MMMMMREKEEKNERVLCEPAGAGAGAGGGAGAGAGEGAGAEPNLFLQWGNGKRLRCVRVRDPHISEPSSSNAARFRRKITSRSSDPFLQPARRNSENRKSASGSPEKEDRYYTTRGSVAGLGLGLDENGKAGGSIMMDGGERVGGSGGDENRGEIVWPKLYISLSSKEKEEDFMAIKGCKPPQRPKKRAKIIQRTLLLVSPGAWLSEMCQEKYEVREKKSSKKVNED
ncbi:transcription factor SOX-1-like isoform X3 [Camellia sinensis]|uniref:transcription factor SOX-1-like isoform X2 n=1 Tax=Camellia sinensis TaxID=4442 RepID=UPI0010366E42|nr:transcription factor SOX-1-like isoform X2 [Camellia sinensis]XP_028066163.1 transcription factor SOX-1-like isoform X3 [Camellia sinensis]